MHLAWPLAAVLAASAAIAALAGLAVGVAAARLRGPYLAGVTLMLAVALPSLATRFTGVFGGDQGLAVNISTPPAFLGANFPLTRWQAWISCAAALIVLVLLANLARSRIGRSWRAVRDDEAAAALAGLNVAALRILAFVVSAACAGLAGALLGITTTLVSPGSFTVTLSIALLTGAVLGGLGSLAGAVWGSLIIVLVPTYVTDVATSHGLSSSWPRTSRSPPTASCSSPSSCCSPTASRARSAACSARPFPSANARKAAQSAPRAGRAGR